MGFSDLFSKTLFLCLFSFDVNSYSVFTTCRALNLFSPVGYYLTYFTKTDRIVFI